MRILGLILVAALLHGLVYVFVILPWQHYDEPSHFEYIWIVARTRRLPETSEAPIELRRDLVRSMLEYDFYRGLHAPNSENLQPGVPVPGLLYAQLDEPPLYYALASIPVALLQAQPLHIQLYGARMVSLALFLLTIVAVWGVTKEIISPDSPVRLLVPLSAALLPGFTELMTAANNDVGAIAVFSWFLWGCVRLIQRGFTFGRLVWVMGTAILSIFTKSTVFVAVPLGIFAIFLLLTKTRWGKWIWLAGAIGLLIAMLLALTWQDASKWHRATSQAIPTRARLSSAPHGDHVLQILTFAPTTPSWLRPLYQPIPKLLGKTLTLGVWMWTDASEAIEIRTPALSTAQKDTYELVQISRTPTFYVFPITLPEETSRAWLTLFPAQTSPITVYYDGLVLAEGIFDSTEPPIFSNEAGTRGTWGGVPFQNLLRNPSAETAQPAFRPEIDDLLARIIPDNARPSMLLASLLDLAGTNWYYRVASRNLIETFWARFGWGHIPLARQVYTVLGWITLAGIVGGAGTLIVQWRSLPIHGLIFLGVVLVIIWGATFLRGAIFIFVRDLFVPGARYAYPAIAPTLLFIVAGWQAILTFISRFFQHVVTPKHFVKAGTIIIGLLLILLDGYSVLTVLRFNG